MADTPKKANIKLSLHAHTKVIKKYREKLSSIKEMCFKRKY